MPSTLTDEALNYLLDSAGLTLTDAQKADLKTIHDGLTAMKARVRQPSLFLRRLEEFGKRHSY